ncbi:MAG: phage regulatory protein/antirepressor Ant [Prevotella sp.]|jgi:Rha family phage regulatory protein|nr:phage regulatory protein/antirepressor Ant [Prevotella sp.]
MEKLVQFNENDKPVTNSLLVAEKFGKEHKDVMRSIRDLLTSAQNCADLFVLSEYQDAYGRMQPMYIMNRDGFTLLAMGFTGKDALKFKMDFINAFNEMETLLNSDSYILLRGMKILDKRVKEEQQKCIELESELGRKEEIIEIKDKQITELTPDAEYAKQVLSSKSTLTTTQIAKQYGMAAKTLNKKLHELGVQYKQSRQWILYEKYQNKDYTRVNTYSTTINGETKTHYSTVWTEKGRRFIIEILQKKLQS